MKIIIVAILLMILCWIHGYKTCEQKKKKPVGFDIKATNSVIRDNTAIGYDE